MNKSFESIDGQLDLDGLCQWQLPNGKLIDSKRARIEVLANPGMQRLDLLIQVIPEHFEDLNQTFELWSKEPVHRFHLEKTVLQAILPELAFVQNAEEWLKVGGAALLELKNYSYAGPASFDSISVIG